MNENLPNGVPTPLPEARAKTQEQWREYCAALLAESLSADAPLFVADRPLLAALRAALVAGAPLGEHLDRARKLREVPVVTAGRWYVRVADAASAAEAEARLYAGLGSPIDTRLDVVLHRSLSRPVSRLTADDDDTPPASRRSRGGTPASGTARSRTPPPPPPA